jgi:hypothetical protein
MTRQTLLSTFLFAAVLSPVALYGDSCLPPRSAELAVLQLRVESFHGENVIEAFDPNVLSYDAVFPESANVGVLWVRAKDPKASIYVQHDGEVVPLVWHSVAKLDVPLGSSELIIDVVLRGPTTATERYVVQIIRGEIFACTEQGIREAIAHGGGPHFFDCDGPTTVLTAAEIVIDNDVMLDGRGDMIVDAGGGGGAGGAGGAGLMAAEVAPKANGLHRVFSIPEGVTAELAGFTVTGGSTPGDGGGILNAGMLTVTTSTVTGNSADRGGGIHNLETGNLTVANSAVAENTAERFGGGIRTIGAAEMIDSVVTNNTAMMGGGGIAVYRTGTMTIRGCTVIDNVAAWSGGIGNLGDLTVVNTTVSGNTALSEDGGGIENFDDATATLLNTTVSLNTAGADGGGILNEGALTLTDSMVSGNSTVVNGGGIHNNGGALTLTNTMVESNSAGSDGGGIYNFEGALTLIGTVVAGNTAVASGGGIESYSGSAELVGSTVSGNTATYGIGGGIENTDQASLSR